MDNVIEIWKDVVGHEGFYKVSSLGRIKGLDRHVKHRESTVYVKGIILRNVPDKNGYLTVHLKRKVRKVHRLVCVAFLPNPDNKPQVNHINGDKTDNRLENLEWCTISENHKHALSTGLRVSKKGEKVHNAKLTEEQAKEIKYRHKDISVRDICEMYKIKNSTIYQIRNKRSWKHI